MKTLKSLLISSIFLTVFSASAQNMEEGFTYLETGKYAQAETFFNGILKSYPDNKTARLCYGRAIGLNGKAQEAIDLFTRLLKDYPNDFEVKLNYGESLLWNNNFTVAKEYYKDLVTEDAKSFAALLGFANTLSNLKEYENAIIYINNALEVSPGNPNALTSKKYIYLGYAYQNQQAQNYDKAEMLLTKNLETFGDDKDTLLNLANLYLIWNKQDSAEAMYTRLSKQQEHKTVALNGLALAAHLNGKEKKALALSTQAYESLTANSDKTTAQQTTERYVQALIWTKKYKAAMTLIDNLIINYPNENWVLALRATLNIYKSNFKESLADYNQILVNDSTSFDGNLGKANVLKALGRFDDAYTSAENTLSFYNNQKDAVNFINKMNVSFSPTLDSKASHTFDNGDNKAYSFNTNIRYPLTRRLSVLGKYNYRTTTNTITNNTANSNNLSLGLAYQVVPNITFKGTAGLTSAKAESTDYTQLLTDLSFNIKTFKLQTLDVGYKRQVESFNADLLDRELVQNNYYANYNLSTNFNLGWYTQLMHTVQNDGNTRNLLFTSLYYNLLPKPNLKVGVNYQYITFKDQVPTIYFSPEKFNNYEVFVNLIKDETVAKPNEWFYNLTGAFGYQFIENNPKQTAYRLQGAFGYKLSERSLLNIYGTHSNIASATAAGFTFTEIGLRFKHIF
ncbi:tetratricopeptide repeat protein [Ichthyenterobacterium sp. W332]|uniref:Tetratricopeptide repeat protein n=1 Tax=Microcosmobacter mediterraneus TaxID=3075607 RepID=A0ABU2YLF4_9FLAO|nr:tetratricopeptide repeat protein [Ichthyenterobacterium sp. W332]MDT0558981.1 tetratricopeptide repeat protein [Ichthyenterobacterium sp. W332]